MFRKCCDLRSEGSKGVPMRSQRYSQAHRFSDISQPFQTKHYFSHLESIETSGEKHWKKPNQRNAGQSWKLAHWWRIYQGSVAGRSHALLVFLVVTVLVQFVLIFLLFWKRWDLRPVSTPLPKIRSNISTKTVAQEGVISYYARRRHLVLCKTASRTMLETTPRTMLGTISYHRVLVDDGLAKGTGRCRLCKGYW